VGVRNLWLATDWGLPDVLAAATINPAALLGHSARLDAGCPANLIVFRRDRGRFALKRVCVDGEWTEVSAS
jgi:predicted amidohydrolase